MLILLILANSILALLFVSQCLISDWYVIFYDVLETTLRRNVEPISEASKNDSLKL